MNVNDETSKAAASGRKERRGLPMLELFEECLRDGIRNGRQLALSQCHACTRIYITHAGLREWLGL